MSLITASMVMAVVGPTVVDLSAHALWPRIVQLMKHGQEDGIRSVIETGVSLAAMRSVTQDDSTWTPDEVSLWVANFGLRFQKPVVDALVKDDCYLRLLATETAGVETTESPDLVWPQLQEALDSVSGPAEGLGLWLDEFTFQLRPAIAWAIHEESLQRKRHDVAGIHDWLLGTDTLIALQRMAAPVGLSPRIRRQGWLRILDLMEAHLSLYFRGQVGFSMAQALLPNPDEPLKAHQELDVWVEVQNPRGFRGGSDAPPLGVDTGWSEISHAEVSEQAHNKSTMKSWREVADGIRNTVLLGNPGHGKTWLLTLLATDRTRGFRNHVAEYGGTEGKPFPIFSRVDQLVMEDTAGSYDRLDEILVATLRARCGIVTEPDGHYDDLLWKDLERHVDDYGVELFLDALDEAPDGLRGWIRDWQIDHPPRGGRTTVPESAQADEDTKSLAFAIAEQGSGRIVISSRLAGYRQPDGVDGAWETVTLSPLRKENCLKLAQLWDVPDTALKAMKLDLDGATTMGHVLRVPLLLNIACILALDGRPWPKSVKDLYSGYINYRVLMAEHWAREPTRTPVVPYDIGQTEAILGDLALAFSGQGETRWQDRMPSQRVREILDEHLEPGETSSVALGRLTQSGLIVGATPSSAGQVYYFQHRTIAEYLVSKRVTDTGQWPLFLTPDFWFHRDWDRTLQLIGDLVDADDYAAAIAEQGTDLLGRGTQLVIQSLTTHNTAPKGLSAWVTDRWIELVRRADEYNGILRLRQLARVKSEWFYPRLRDLLGPQLVADLTLRDDDQVVPFLIDIAETEPRLRTSAIEALGTGMQDNRFEAASQRMAEDWLCGQLNGQKDTAVIVSALARIPSPRPPTGQALQRFLEGNLPNPELYASVLQALWRSEPPSLADLIDRLGNAEDGICLAAIRTLGARVRSGTPDGSPALFAIKDIVKTLLKMSSGGQVADVRNTPEENRPNRAILAVAAIDALAGHTEAAFIREIFRVTNEDEVAGAAARALAFDRTPETTQVLLDRLEYFLHQEDGMAGLAPEEIINALGGRDDSAVVRRLQGLLEHPTEWSAQDYTAYVVHAAAISALAMTKPDESFRNLLIAVLAAQDEGPVTRSAARGLVSMATPSTLAEDVETWVASCHRNPQLARNAFYDATVCEDLAWATSMLSPKERLAVLARLDTVWRVFDPL